MSRIDWGSQLDSSERNRCASRPSHNVSTVATSKGIQTRGSADNREEDRATRRGAGDASQSARSGPPARSTFTKTSSCSTSCRKRRCKTYRRSLAMLACSSRSSRSR
jgi:hypothetical protein